MHVFEENAGWQFVTEIWCTFSYFDRLSCVTTWQR